jgi:hypothetical protein
MGTEGQHAGVVSDLESKYALPPGLLRGVWGAESSFGANNGRNDKGAEGDFQFLDGTAKQYGVKRGDFDSEADGAARYLRDLIKKHHGDVKAALFDYNGVVKNVAAGEKYVDRVQQYGGMPSMPTEWSAKGKGGDYTPVPPKQADDGAMIAVPPEHAAKVARDPAQSSGKNRTPVPAPQPDDGTMLVVPPEHAAKAASDPAQRRDKDSTPLPAAQPTDGTIVEVPPETKPAKSKKASASGGRDGVTDTVVLDINMNVIKDSAYGAKVTEKVSTSIPVPRGSGTRTLGVMVN